VGFQASCTLRPTDPHCRFANLSRGRVRGILGSFGSCCRRIPSIYSTCVNSDIAQEVCHCGEDRQTEGSIRLGTSRLVFLLSPCKRQRLSCGREQFAWTRESWSILEASHGCYAPGIRTYHQRFGVCRLRLDGNGRAALFWNRDPGAPHPLRWPASWTVVELVSRSDLGGMQGRKDSPRCAAMPHVRLSAAVVISWFKF